MDRIGRKHTILVGTMLTAAGVGTSKYRKNRVAVRKSLGPIFGSGEEDLLDFELVRIQDIIDIGNIKA